MSNEEQLSALPLVFTQAIDIDIPDILRLDAQTPPIHQVINTLTDEELHIALTDPERTIIVSHNETGQLVGFGIVQSFPNEGNALLTHLVVSDEFRGTQVSQRLFEESAAASFQKGITQLSARVLSTDTQAIEFFELVGMKEKKRFDSGDDTVIIFSQRLPLKRTQ